LKNLNIHFIKRFIISTIPVDKKLNKEGSFAFKVNEDTSKVPEIEKSEEESELDKEISLFFPLSFKNNSFSTVTEEPSVMLSNTFIHHPPCFFINFIE